VRGWAKCDIFFFVPERPHDGYETINVTPVTPRIGAEVAGLTLAKPLSNRQVEELHQALAEHQVLFFRDQLLDVESHKALGRYFGELHIHPNTPGPEGHPEILPIHADANSKRIAGEYWHSDVSCDEEPPLGSILYLHTVPHVGGDTLFASQYAAYDALSPRMKAYLEGLTATHSGDTSIERPMCWWDATTVARFFRRHRIPSYAPIP
jgi:taurine dioxygenase